MELNSIMEWLLGQTGPTAIAVMALYFMQQNHTAYVARERENAEVHRGDKTRMMEALENNAVATAKLEAAIVSLSHTIATGGRGS